ncbi:kinesin-like protein kif22 [Phtheirospermum japonicum]|uniref:Kinesin-like protein n=1 Tax=Phtheirospermum japonicum TaxID=374723 RepID=A0A830DC89_9LAMI|nr:kinesin-like protein kif22 [Phtheirospermum japonicum]
MATQAENFPITPTHAEKSFSTPAKNHHQPTPISKVRVVLKLRPFLPLEISSRNGNPNSCVSIQDSESSVDEITVLLKDHDTSRNECYKLDAVFGQEADNVSQIFEKELRPLIPGLFQGHNATVFAYGATGSGKTYTMQGTDHIPGLMPLSISNILSMCEFTGSAITISYYEIYLDKCYDLIDPNEKEILVWNDKAGQIHLKGLAQIEVSSLAEFYEIFSSALQRRKVAQTGLNDLSSRSHGVLAITILSPSHNSVGNVVTGKLNLIDLAGNEDNRRTCNDGIRLQESAKINQSLFALSNVIYALNNGQPRIPYRESKLTRILQDSLGGTSRALMVACLNPGDYQESVHTVSLAARSRHVSNFVGPAQSNGKSNAKVDMEAKLVAWLESKGKTKSSQRMGLCRSPFLGRTPSSVKPIRKLNTSVHSNKTKAVRSQMSPCKAGRNLFQGLSYEDHNREAQNLSVAEINEEKFTIPIYGDALESNPDLSYKSSFDEKEAIITKSINSISLSPTPKLNPISDDGENNFQILGTPLYKLTARSSSLKSTLVQDYIDFLNTASSEELMELKGIGPRIAEYIVELRETSPLKSLGDLEKIGLSSKQRLGFVSPPWLSASSWRPGETGVDRHRQNARQGRLFSVQWSVFAFFVSLIIREGVLRDPSEGRVDLGIQPETWVVSTH